MQKIVVFSPKKGPKKDRGLSVFLDRSSGGPVLAKMGRSGRSLRTGPRTDPSLLVTQIVNYMVQAMEQWNIY